jgi:hypothetical protein
MIPHFHPLVRGHEVPYDVAHQRDVLGPTLKPAIEYNGNSFTRGKPARERTGPPPLLLRDCDLDFSIKHHHDQQQEEKMAHHLILRSGWPAGSFPPAVEFWAGEMNKALSRAAQLPRDVLDTLPGDPAGAGAAGNRPFHGFRA